MSSASPRRRCTRAQGDPKTQDTLEKSAVLEYLLEQYDLDIDADFAAKLSTKGELEGFLTALPEK